MQAELISGFHSNIRSKNKQTPHVLLEADFAYNKLSYLVLLGVAIVLASFRSTMESEPVSDLALIVVEMST